MADHETVRAVLSKHGFRKCASPHGTIGDVVRALTYKGYAARIEFDPDDRIFFGRVAGIRDGVGFHADTVAALIAAFHEAVDDYIETCARIGKQPLKPYSGNLMLRIDPFVHARIAMAAELAGKSLNQWGEEAVLKAAGEGAAR